MHGDDHALLVNVQQLEIGDAVPLGLRDTNNLLLVLSACGQGDISVKPAPLNLVTSLP